MISTYNSPTPVDKPLGYLQSCGRAVRIAGILSIGEPSNDEDTNLGSQWSSACQQGFFATNPCFKVPCYKLLHTQPKKHFDCIVGRTR